MMEQSTTIRAIEQYGGRSLRVVVNPNIRPQRIVTVFFDRRIGGRNETKGGSQE